MPFNNADTEAAFQRAEAAVTRDDTVNASAETLISNLAQMLRDATANAVDHAELQARVNAIADGLDANQTRLATAVEANTPSAGGGGEPPTP